VAFELGTTNGISLVVDPYGRIVAERHRAWEPGLLEPEFNLERLLDNATWRFRRRYCSYTLLGGGRIAGAG